MSGQVEAADIDLTTDGASEAEPDTAAGDDRLDPSVWSPMAACRGADPKLFFPAPRCPPSDEAKAYCAQCPVKGQCLEYAVSLRLAGIWGGTSETQRIKLRRLRRERSGMGAGLRAEARASAAV